MTRRTIEFEIDDPGSRDHRKRFLITEMPADQGERWTGQLGYLIAKYAGTTFDAESGGAAALASFFASNGMSAEAKVAAFRALQDPSLDADTWSCIQYIHNPKNPPQAIVHGVNSQIEEIRTRGLLRIQVMNLHVGFFSKEKASTSKAPPPPG